MCLLEKCVVLINVFDECVNIQNLTPKKNLEQYIWLHLNSRNMRVRLSISDHISYYDIRHFISTAKSIIENRPAQE